MNGRHEEKYLLGYAETEALRSRLSCALHTDTHGKNGCYTISSLYFDDTRLSAYSDKEEGQAEHIKFRIRLYDGDQSFIRLEKKIKRGSITYKTQANITSDMLPVICSGERLDTNDAALLELYAQMRASGLKPSAVVRYERQAFLLPGSDMRITLDSRLTALPGRISSLPDVTSSGIPVFPTGQVILEVKYNGYLPTSARLLCGDLLTQISVSKYAMCIGSASIGTGRSYL